MVDVHLTVLQPCGGQRTVVYHLLIQEVNKGYNQSVPFSTHWDIRIYPQGKSAAGLLLVEQI